MADYPTIEDCIGETPLVRLQRIPGDTSNTILVKLEGNNPAGSVKDRPAISMIQRAEDRGEIKPGDDSSQLTMRHHHVDGSVAYEYIFSR